MILIGIIEDLVGLSKRLVGKKVVDVRYSWDALSSPIWHEGKLIEDPYSKQEINTSVFICVEDGKTLRLTVHPLVDNPQPGPTFKDLIGETVLSISWRFGFATSGTINIDIDVESTGGGFLRLTWKVPHSPFLKNGSPPLDKGDQGDV